MIFMEPSFGEEKENKTYAIVAVPPAPVRVPSVQTAICPECYIGHMRRVIMR